jgi:hypothetical protein
MPCVMSKYTYRKCMIMRSMALCVGVGSLVHACRGTALTQHVFEFFLRLILIEKTRSFGRCSTYVIYIRSQRLAPSNGPNRVCSIIFLKKEKDPASKP